MSYTSTPPVRLHGVKGTLNLLLIRKITQDNNKLTQTAKAAAASGSSLPPSVQFTSQAGVMNSCDVTTSVRTPYRLSMTDQVNFVLLQTGKWAGQG
jgi:hypothetical protein